MVRAKRQAVTEEHPLQTNQAQYHQALHQHGEHIFASDQPAVEKR
jgi:hypothetical protein